MNTHSSVIIKICHRALAIVQDTFHISSSLHKLLNVEFSVLEMMYIEMLTREQCKRYVITQIPMKGNSF